MEKDIQSPSVSDDLARRRVPCLIAYLSPFRIVEADTFPPWNVTIDQVNGCSWDYVKLHEIVGGIDVGLPRPYHMVVARDGALALPPVEQIRSDQAAVEFFNRCLAALLIGGVYCEAISPDGLDLGSIIDWKYVRSHRPGLAGPNRFHHHVRQRQASAMEAIALMDPQNAELTTLSRAMLLGLTVLDQISQLRGDLLLKGITGIARRDWESALSNLWIVVEQLISHLWERDILQPAMIAGANKARREYLRDSRTWTASVRIETLHQKGVLDLETIAILSTTRKARNDLSHEGTTPTEEAAQAAYDSVRALVKVTLPQQDIPLFKLDLSDHSISDPFAPPEPLRGEPKFWMAIPKLPGEEELEKAEAAVRR